MDDWYLEDNGQAAGPTSLEDLQFLRDRGKLLPTHRVRFGKHGDWQLAGEVSRLFKPPTATPVTGDEPKPHTAKTETVQPPPIDAEPSYRGLKQAMIGMFLGCLIALILFLLWDRSDLHGVAGGGGSRNGSGGVDDTNDDPLNGLDGDMSTDQSGDEPSRESIEPPGFSDLKAKENTDCVQAQRTVAELEQDDPQPDALISAPNYDLTESEHDGNGNAGNGIVGATNAFDGRVRQAGGKSGDVQVTLIWNNRNDLDLHVRCPDGTLIYYKYKSGCGGELDVDKNAVAFELTRTPVENVVWNGPATPGRYEVYVHHYKNWGDRDPTPFSVRIKLNGKETRIDKRLSHGQKHSISTFTVQ